VAAAWLARAAPAGSPLRRRRSDALADGRLLPLRAPGRALGAMVQALHLNSGPGG